MEVKGYLLRCMRRLKTGVALVPRLIVVDAGANNADIKAELDRWMEEHPSLRGVKVVLPPRPSLLGRWCLTALIRFRKIFRNKEWQRDQAEDWAQRNFPASQQDVAVRVARTLNSHFRGSITKIKPETRLKEDLMANDLEPVKFVLELEQEFQLEISDADGEALATVGDVISYVHGKTMKPTPTDHPETSVAST